MSGTVTYSSADILVGTAVDGHNSTVSLGIAVPGGVTLSDPGIGVAGDAITVGIQGVNTSATYSGLKTSDGSPIVTLNSNATILGVIVPAGAELMLTNGSFGSGASVAVSASPLCLMQGTRAATPAGDCAVEELRIGDLVMTAFGAPRQIAWLGYVTVFGGRKLAAENQPVRIRAGAFGDGVPSVDLWTSPGHAVFQEGCLIPIRHLTNGLTIAHVALDHFTYWHVALDSHDVIVAEGLEVESLLADAGNIDSFDNADTAVMLSQYSAPFAPMITHGPLVSEVFQRLKMRAGALLDA